MAEKVVSGIPVACDDSILPSGVTIDTITSSQPFTEWLDEMDRKRFNLRSVRIQAVNMFGPRVGFIMFKADVVDSSGSWLPDVVFMRGGCVAILPVLICDDAQFAVLAVQPRLPTGKFDFVEIPAGMLDGGGNFIDGSAKLLEQRMKLNELVDLSELAGHGRGHFPSPGGSDETISVRCSVKRLTGAELAELKERLAGNEEGSRFTFRIVPLADLWKIPDGKTIVAYTLFRELEASILIN